MITAHPGYTAGQKLLRVVKKVITRAMDGTAKDGSGLMPQVITRTIDGPAKECGGDESCRILSVWAGGAGGISRIHCAKCTVSYAALTATEYQCSADSFPSGSRRPEAIGPIANKKRILACCLVVCVCVLVYMYYMLSLGTEGYRASVYC